MSGLVIVIGFDAVPVDHRSRGWRLYTLTFVRAALSSKSFGYFKAEEEEVHCLRKINNIIS